MEKEMSLFDKAALDATKITYITPENAVFEDCGGFIMMTFENEKRRVHVHLLFPYDSPEKFIGILDGNSHEIGMIEDLSVFPEEQALVIKKEISRKYYFRKIAKIMDIKDRHGMTSWKIKEDNGNIVDFSLRDTYGSIFRLSTTHLVISDEQGNRFEIEDTEKLDRKSYRKLELYL